MINKLLLHHDGVESASLQLKEPDGLPVASIRPLRSPLPWVGSKHSVVKNLTDAMPKDWDEFRDPFVGGGSLPIYLIQKYRDRKYWFNDLDPYTYEFWKVLSTDYEQLVKTLTQWLLEFPTNEDKIFLCDWSKKEIHDAIGVTRAAMFYVMCKTSWGSMPFNVTRSHPKGFNAKGIAYLLKVGRLLQSVDIKVTNLDFANCVTHDPKVFTFYDRKRQNGCVLALSKSRCKIGPCVILRPRPHVGASALKNVPVWFLYFVRAV